MAYTNSPLATVKILSPATNHYGARTHAIDRITPHMVVGQCTATALGQLFAQTSRRATSNYGVGYDGQIGLYCEEKNAAGTSSSYSNDNRAITIEIASDTREPFALKPAAYNAAIKLMADICKRNGKTVLLWLGSKEKALNYSPKANEMVITFHCWFGATNCPGTYIMNHITDMVAQVNKILGGGGSDKPTYTAREAAQKCINDGINGQARKNFCAEIGLAYETVQAQIDLMLGKDTGTAIKDLAGILPAVGNGSEGDAVKFLQTELKRMGYYTGAVDGSCGTATTNAIKALQTNWRTVYGTAYVVDGWFGPVCWKRLLLGA